MDNKHYNTIRQNGKKQKYRFLLGAQQLVNYPLLNCLWMPFAIGVTVLYFYMKKYILNIEVYPMFEKIFFVSMITILIVFPVICAIGLIQLIGFFFAIKDEADLELVFYNKRDVKTQRSLLIYKKKNRKAGITRREFYTTIPMEQWQKEKEAICDRMDIHIIGDITYGGRKKNKGHQICFESGKGRIPIEKDIVFYDNELEKDLEKYKQ